MEFAHSSNRLSRNFTNCASLGLSVVVLKRAKNLRQRPSEKCSFESTCSAHLRNTLVSVLNRFAPSTFRVGCIGSAHDFAATMALTHVVRVALMSSNRRSITAYKRLQRNQTGVPGD